MHYTSTRILRLLLPLAGLVIIGVFFLTRGSKQTVLIAPNHQFDPAIDAPFYVGCQEPDINAPRANATLVILARNSDIQGVSVSMSSIERHFNRWFHYPYVILNDVPFNDEFKNTVSRYTSSHVDFGVIPKSDWEFPASVSTEKLNEALDAQGDASFPYGRLKSYHQMCRWFSGKFFDHPLVTKYEWYWRVEPDVQFFCDMTYDPFVEMEKKGKVYGFNAYIKEVGRTIPSLFRQTLAFKKQKKIPDGDLWQTITDCWEKNTKKPPELANLYMDGCTYNLCHYWSNFEIARLDFWQSQQYRDYFEFLEKSGGFWHERWGDAPVHTFAVAMFLNASQVHYFRDVGYQHTSIGHCPYNAPNQIPLSKYPRYSDYDDDWALTDPVVKGGVGCRCKCPGLRETETHSCFDALLPAMNPKKYTKA